MPKALHDALEAEADKKGFKGKKRGRFVFGTMTNIEKARAAKKGRRPFKRPKRKVHPKVAAKKAMDRAVGR